MDSKYSLVTKFGANVTHVHILQWLVGLEIANLYDEWVGPVTFTTDEELSHHYCVVRSATERANPPFGGSQGRRVDGEGLIGGVPGGGGLETADVGAVTQFGLSITTNNLVFGGALKEELMLFGGTLLTKGHLFKARGQLAMFYVRWDVHLEETYQEHARVQTVGSWLSDKLIGRVQFLCSPLVLLSQLLKALGLSQRPLEPVHTTEGVVLGLVEHLLGLQQRQ